MTPIRHVLLLLFAIALSAGCRTVGIGNLAQPAAVAPRTTMNAASLVKEHNRNAERIQSLKADPSIDANWDGGKAGLRGHLAMERPRNFRLDVYHPTASVADIGSNDTEFWFWAAPSKSQTEKAIYYCKYEDLSKSQLAATFQPDWILEAMGLRVITEEEAEEIRVKRDTQPGRLILTYPPSKTGGEGATRVTILDEATHRILEHRVYSADQKTLLAKAVVQGYNEYKLFAEGTAPAESVFLPARVKLEWVKEKLALDVTMRGAKVNPKIPPKQRTAMFIEPTIAGCARRNLAEMSGVASGPTTIRETRPAPPTRVRLGAPAPFGIDDARRAPRDPVALSADLPEVPSYRDEVIGPPIPSAPEPEFLKAADNSGSWRAAPLGLER